MKKIVNFNLTEEIVNKGYIADYVMNSGKTYELYFNTEKEFEGIVINAEMYEEEIEQVTEYFFSPDFTDVDLEEYDIVEEIKNKEETIMTNPMYIEKQSNMFYLMKEGKVITILNPTSIVGLVDSNREWPHGYIYISGFIGGGGSSHRLQDVSQNIFDTYHVR